MMEVDWLDDSWVHRLHGSNDWFENSLESKDVESVEDNFWTHMEQGHGGGFDIWTLTLDAQEVGYAFHEKEEEENYNEVLDENYWVVYDDPYD